ncbi:MAG: glycosyltransferase [Saprospiraceae bacterium]|nr:glycosyltransferase [Saprospiraceae bacterium]
MELTFSIILPLYRQIAHLPVIFKEYTEKLTSLNETWELIFVVNGPDDGSYDLAKKYADENKNIKTIISKEPGWGKAVKIGIQNAEGRLICYTNSARTNVDELLMILNYALVNNNNVVKANRIIRESLIRRIGSVIFNFENRTVFNTPIWDVNGTPKVFPEQILKEHEIYSEGDLIDAELIARCIKNHIPVIEIPIFSTDRISGKSTTSFKSAFKMYFGIFKLKKKI